MIISDDQYRVPQVVESQLIELVQAARKCWVVVALAR